MYQKIVLDLGVCFVLSREYLIASSSLHAKYFCLTDWLIDWWTPVLPMTFLLASNVSVGDFWCLRAVSEQVSLGWWRIAFSNRILGCRADPWLKLAFQNYWFKTLSGNKKKGFGQTEHFAFCFQKTLCSAWKNFRNLSESLAVELFWHSCIVSHPSSDLSAILINLFLFFSLLLIDVKEQWDDSASLFSTW